MERRQWERLGEAVLERRTAEGWTQQQVWDRHGPSDTLQSDIEGKRWKPVRNVKDTLRKIDAGMQWEPGSAGRILDGGEPTPIGSPLSRADIARRIVDAAPTAHDEHFERAERLLIHSQDSVRRGDYRGALHGLEGAQSTVELLIDRITYSAIQLNAKDDQDVVETSTEPDASGEGLEAQEVSAVGGEGDDLSDREFDIGLQKGILGPARSDGSKDKQNGPSFGQTPGAAGGRR